MDQDRTRLAEFGGPVTLTKAWAISLLKRMNYTKRRGTTKYSMPLADLLQVKAGLLQEIIDVVKMEDVPASIGTKLVSI